MYDLFLCHTGADKAWTRELGERLETPSRDSKAFKVWFDEWDIVHGRSVVTSIDEGLRTSRYVGVILSPKALDAEWPTAEWQSQVMDDPAGKRGRVLPIILHKIDPESGAPLEVPFALKLRRWFDFSDPRKFEKEFEELVIHLREGRPRRGAARLGSAIDLKRVSQEGPDRVLESLLSNLFPVTRPPEMVHSDTTTASTYKEVWAHYSGNQLPPFALSAGRLYSFIPPTFRPHPFAEVLKPSAARAESPSSFISDKDRSRLLVGMLNAGLREHLYQQGIRSPKSDRSQFFCPTFDGKPRLFSWGIGRDRTLAKMHNGPDGKPFGVHYSARMRCIILGAQLFLLVEPAWLFTLDGVLPIQGPQVGVLSTKWGGRERNASVLRNVLMWGWLLSQGKPQARIELGGGQDMIVRATPAHSEITGGIEVDQIVLTRIFRGEGAGEVVDAADELDLVANLALAGIAPDPGEELEWSAPDLDDNEESESSDPGLPF